MDSSRESGTQILRTPPGPGALVQASIDPLVAIGTLAAVVSLFGGRFDGACLILALLVFAMTFPGSLARDTGSAGELALDIATGWAAVVVLLLFLGWASRTLGAFDDRVILAWALATPAALFGAHRLLPVLWPRVLAAEGLQKTAVIAGANELGRKLARRLRDNPLLGMRFAGYFDDRAASRLQSIPPRENLGGLSALADYARAQPLDVIYIALPMASQPRILKLLEDLRNTTASIYFVPDIFVSDLIQARVDSIGGLPVVAVCESPFYGFNGVVKRASDFVLAALILLVISPLMVALAVGVKLSSPGPVLFKQRRYGLYGKRIVVYKFRSMTVAEDGEVVGPRPHAVAHNEMYRKLIRGYMVRHKVKPGITGLAQVSGWRGETDTVEKMKARIDCDLAYLRNWSLLLDLQIILKTIVVVLQKDNAY